MQLSRLKRYAEKNGMKIYKDIIYGEFDGYMVMMKSVNQAKYVSVSARLTSEASDLVFIKLYEMNFRKRYNADYFNVNTEGVNFALEESSNTMKRVASVMAFLPSLLTECGAKPCTNCPCCGKTINEGEGCVIRVGNLMVDNFHKDCVEKFNDDVKLVKEQKKIKRAPNLKGVIGACVAVLLMLVVYVMLLFIKELSFLTLFIAFLLPIIAKKGYVLATQNPEYNSMVITVISVVTTGIIFPLVWFIDSFANIMTYGHSFPVSLYATLLYFKNDFVLWGVCFAGHIVLTVSAILWKIKRPKTHNVIIIE